MVTSGVVWCVKDNQLVPLQLNAIRLHGVLTQAHWTAISEFLQRVANKQLILHDNGFTEFTDQHKELLLRRQKTKTRGDDKKMCQESTKEEDSNINKWHNCTIEQNDLENILNSNIEEGDDQFHMKLSTLGQILETKAMDSSEPKLLMFKIEERDGGRVPQNEQVCLKKHESFIDSQPNLFISDLFGEGDNSNEETEETSKETECIDEKKIERKLSEQNDEIALRLLRKYCKYSRDALDNKIISAIEASNEDCDNQKTQVIRRRKLGYCPKQEKLYENLNEIFHHNPEEGAENERNEHVFRWLKEQQKQKGLFDVCSLPQRRHSAIETSPTDNRKSSLTSKSDRKSSSSGFESRKSSITLPLMPETKMPGSRKSSLSSILDSGKFSGFNSRKDSITSVSSCSESEEGSALNNLATQWQKILKKQLGSKTLEKRFKKQREAWARNTRKLSSGSENEADFSQQP